MKTVQVYLSQLQQFYMSLMPHLQIESDALLEALGVAVAPGPQPNLILREDPEAINEPLPENPNEQDQRGLVIPGPVPSAEQGTSCQ